MRPGRDIFWRLLPMLTSLVLMTLLLQPCLGCQDAAICQVSCCTTQPSCVEAVNVTCFCPNLKKLEIKAGDIPTSVKSILISQVGSLTIDEGAVHDLHYLTSFSLRSVGNVILEKGGLKLHENTSLHSFKAIGANLLHIESHAFAGNWSGTTSVIFQDIKTLKILSQGFSYTTEQPGPSIKMENITTLDVASGVFNAFVKQLYLKNVQMPQCRWRAFNEKIDNLQLNNVTIPKVETLCFNYNVDQKINDVLRRHVAIKSSYLDIVEPRAFSGTITSLKLENTELNTVLERGFKVHMKDLNIIRSKIGTLHSGGLFITSDHMLSLRDMQIDHLHKNAFTGIWIANTSDRCHAVHIYGLEIKHADDGSLSLPTCLPLDVWDLHIQAPFAERCPTETWARKLLGADSHRPLSIAEYKVFESLSDLHYCEMKDETTPKRIDDGRHDKGAHHVVNQVHGDSSLNTETVECIENGLDGRSKDYSGGAKQSLKFGVSNDFMVIIIIVLIVVVVILLVLILHLWTKKNSRTIARRRSDSLPL